MNGSVMGRLIAKDLYLFRWLIAAALFGGVASLAISTVSEGDNVSTGVNVGIVLFMTTIIALGVFIPMLAILKERQDRSQLFVLSLPVSPAQYSRAKVVSSVIAFLIPWLLLTGGVVIATTLSGKPGGGMPMFVVMMMFFLLNFCLLMAVVVITMSEVWAISSILITNVSVPIFLASISKLPAVSRHRLDAVATWSPTILAILGVEIALIAISLGLAFIIPSRKRDFI